MQLPSHYLNLELGSTMGRISFDMMECLATNYEFAQQTKVCAQAMKEFLDM